MTSLGYKTHYIILKQKNIFHIFYTENEQHHAKKQKNTTEINSKFAGTITKFKTLHLH